jgi:hypothetical protein
MSSKYIIQNRDPDKVAKLKEIIDSSFDPALERLKQLLDPTVPTDPNYWKKSTNTLEKDATFKAKAAAEQLRLIQVMMDVSVTPKADDKVNEVEDRQQFARDLIAAVRGQMDPKKIEKFERELGESLGGDEE